MISPHSLLALPILSCMLPTLQYTVRYVLWLDDYAAAANLICSSAAVL
jgi:hypothetical protein